MKKKVKKIPKYYDGTSMVDIIKANNRPNIQLTEFTPVNVLGISSGTAGTIAAGKTWDTMNSTLRTGAVVDAIGTGINTAVSSIGKPVTFAGVANGALSGAQAGAAIGGPWGAAFGAVGGAALSSIGNTASTDGYGNYTKSTGITRLLRIGKSDDEIIRLANREKNSVIANAQTQNLRMKYENEVPTGSINVLAAEGGIMRQPVDALVSKGELIYNPVTKKLSKVPGSKGKPNKKDDVYTRLYEGDIVISNSPTMLMANGKTPALNLEGLVDSNKNQKAKEAIIKKVVNWQEANKTKSQEYAKFDEGWSGELKTWDDYLKNVYKLTKSNKIDKLDNFWGYDSKKKKYNNRWKDVIEHIGSNEALREKAIKDLGGLSYIGTGKDAWDNIVKAANDLKVGDVHRYFRSVGDSLQTNMDPLSSPIVGLSRTITVPKGISQKNVRSSIGGVDHMTSYIPQQESEKLTKLTPEQIKQFGGRDAALLKDTPKSGSSKESINWLDEMSDLLPIVGGLFDKYDWHTESSQITPPRFVPVNADPRPLLRAADESSSIGNYNLANMGVGTGAYMAHSALLASDRAKRYADAYRWQQETNDRLIAQNAGIYNDWRKQRDAYATQAIADTRANEGAAQQMRDSAIRDTYEFMAGRRNDRMRLAMMEPLAKYAFDDDTYKKIYSRAIV